MDSDTPWFEHFPDLVGTVHLNYNSEAWSKTIEILMRYSGSPVDCNAFRDMLEALGKVNWDFKRPFKAVSEVLSLSTLEPLGLGHFYSEVVPWVINELIALPTTLSSVPHLRVGQPNFVILSRRQTFGLLAALYCCCTDLPHVYFTANHQSDVTKLLSMANYMCLMYDRHHADPEYLETTHVSFERRVTERKNLEFWQNLDLPLLDLSSHADIGIEDYSGPCIQVDFANKFIGGGVLIGGNVQEEMAFTFKPECLVSLLFTDVMQDDEAVIIVGAERTMKHTGYGGSFTYKERYNDQASLDLFGRKEVHTVAIDALEIMGDVQLNQEPNAVVRELNKAYSGFLGDSKEREALESGQITQLRPVCTGKWGCGMFGGIPQIKTLIQWAAASRAQRNCVIMTFKDSLLNQLPQVGAKYRGRTIGELVRDMLDVAAEGEWRDFYDRLLAK